LLGRVLNDLISEGQIDFIMELIIYSGNQYKIAEVKSEGITINNVQDALNILADANYNDVHRIILHENNISPDFFDLKTGLAGEILQKFVNYKKKVAVVGEFKKYNSRSLTSFINECNRGNQFFFVVEIKTAITKLSCA
jgi:hypothetical protein